MIEATTKSGFTFRMDENRMDDMEFIEDLARLDNDEVTALPGILERMLGKEQKAKLYDFLRTEHGNVPVQKCADMIGEIMDAAAKKSEEVKNSASSPECSPLVKLP